MEIEQEKKEREIKKSRQNQIVDKGLNNQTFNEEEEINQQISEKN